MIQLLLDYPPSVNHLYIHGTAKKIKTEEAREWEKAALYDIKNQTHGKLINDDCDTINIILLRADKRRADYDNPLKEINDVLKKAGLIKDDSQITCAVVLKGDSDTGKNYIRVSLIHEDWGLLEIYKSQPKKK